MENQFSKKFLDNKLLTRKEASIFLSVSLKTIYNLTKSGKLKTHKVGDKLIRYSIEDLLNSTRKD